ncbi:hypothetical protein DL96DRAFT_1024372 [Flagelloscypha sp. PMI_526]|nr:hypothetical protein DL96DRAFT_1024372 [Flagelloscypha sp. PMI_526]
MPPLSRNLVGDTEDERELKNRMRKMERRIKEMEKGISKVTQVAAGDIVLSHPYSSDEAEPSAQANSATPGQTSDGIDSRSLLRAFLKNKAAFGFFLDPHAVFATDPALSPQRPSSRILFGALRLCAALITAAPNLSELEKLVIHERQTTPNIGRNDQLVLEDIQAEIMLSRFYFYTDRHVDASYHCSKAVALATTLQLGNWTNRPGFRVFRAGETLSSTDGDQIYAFWAIIEADEINAIAQRRLHGLTRACGIPKCNVQVPFPVTRLNYAEGKVSHVLIRDTFLEFEQNPSPFESEDCVETFETKLMLLLALVHTFFIVTTTRAHDPKIFQSEDILTRYKKLNIQVENILQIMPALRQADIQNLRQHSLLILCVLHLHMPLMDHNPVAKRRVIDAALRSFDLACLIPKSTSFLDASFLLTWTTAASVLPSLTLKEICEPNIRRLRAGLQSIARFRKMCPQAEVVASELVTTLARFNVALDLP